MDIGQALDAAYKRCGDRNPASKAANTAALQALPGGNTRTTLFNKPFPITLTRGSGCYVWDLDDHSYVDGLGEFTASITGHSHPVVVAALKAALDNGINLGGHGVHEAQLSQAIKARFPSMDLMRFTNSGTEATMMNILTAQAYTRRTKVMVFAGQYHGGFFSFPVDKVNRTNAPLDFIVAPYNNEKETERLILDNASELACVLFEALIGSGGCMPATRDFAHLLRRSTQQVGALLIMDEVMTSRLSPGGLQQTLGITPDLTTLGKYIGGGMSFGAFGGRADIMNLYDPRRPDCLVHGGTFNNNVMSMAGGVATMTKVATPEAINAMNARGDALRQRLNALCKQHGSILQWTGIGSMLAAHFSSEPVTVPEDIKGADPRLKELLYLHLLEHHVWTTSRCFFSLSMAVGEKECEAIADAVEAFLLVYAPLLQLQANEP